MKHHTSQRSLYLPALIIGSISGSLISWFGQVIIWIGQLRTLYLDLLIIFLAPAGLFIIYLYQKCSPISQQGTALVFKNAQGRDTQLPTRTLPLISLITWTTHLFGGSVGRTGAALQMSAVVAKRVHSATRLAETDYPKLITISMAAGFAGLFQTPFAACFFALEVLAVAHTKWTLLLPASLAAFSANLMSRLLGLKTFSFTLAHIPPFTLSLLIKLVILGFIFGLSGKLFAFFLTRSKRYFSQKIPNPYLRIFLLGLLLSVSLYLFHHGRYTGSGSQLIELSFSEKSIHLYDWLAKLIFTSLTLAAGFQGGEVTPMFAIGASLGAGLAPFMGLPVTFLAALGYICFFASATNTRIAPLFIGLEVFGLANGPYFLLAILATFPLLRLPSVYTAQIPLKNI